MATVVDRSIGVEVGSGEAATGYWTGVARRLSRDPVAIAAALVLVLIVLMAVFALTSHQPIPIAA